MEILTEQKIFSMFPPRNENSHKGDFGRAALVCGSYSMAGAAMFAARACVLCGAGLTNVICPDEIYPILAASLPEPIFTPIKNDLSPLKEAVKSADAVAVGCGLSKSHRANLMLCKTLESAKSPIVIDADGINLLTRNIELLKETPAQKILTPHVGEMSRLCGKSAGYISAHREQTAADFAKEYKVILVLKGHNTVIASPEGEIFINPTGNAGMATGGSGDVLCGMIVSLLAQGLSPIDSACSGVYLHGICGDLSSQKYSQHSTTPSSIIEQIPEIFLKIEG